MNSFCTYCGRSVSLAIDNVHCITSSAACCIFSHAILGYLKRTHLISTHMLARRLSYHPSRLQSTLLSTIRESLRGPRRKVASHSHFRTSHIARTICQILSRPLRRGEVHELLQLASYFRPFPCISPTPDHRESPHACSSMPT
jgi:hypothetical protein